MLKHHVSMTVDKPYKRIQKDFIEIIHRGVFFRKVSTQHTNSFYWRNNLSVLPSGATERFINKISRLLNL